MTTRKAPSVPLGVSPECSCNSNSKNPLKTTGYKSGGAGGKKATDAHPTNFDNFPSVFNDLGRRTELHYIRETPKGVEQCAPEMYPIVCPCGWFYLRTPVQFRTDQPKSSTSDGAAKSLTRLLTYSMW